MYYILSIRLKFMGIGLTEEKMNFTKVHLDFLYISLYKGTLPEN